MIRPQVDAVAKRKGIMSAYQLQKELGVSPTVASRLWKGTFSMIGIDTLDKLCSRLKCSPADILKYMPDK